MARISNRWITTGGRPVHPWRHSPLPQLQDRSGLCRQGAHLNHLQVQVFHVLKQYFVFIVMTLRKTELRLKSLCTKYLVHDSVLSWEDLVTEYGKRCITCVIVRGMVLKSSFKSRKSNPYVLSFMSFQFEFLWLDLHI